MKAWESNIRKVEPYVPGEQPKVQDVIKLNTNENPYGPSENVRKAMEAIDIDRCRLYPDPDVTKLVKSIADYYGMDNNQVFVGVGSDDVDVGLNLVELIDKYKSKLVGEKVYKKYGNKFPLLIKFIDSRQDLSVQVHPDDKLAMERHGCAGKTEMWYIIKSDTKHLLLCSR